MRTLSGFGLLRTCAIATLAVAFAAVARPSLAAPDLKKQVTELLDTGWKISPTALATAEEQYQAVVTAAPGDQRVEYAWTLVLIKQRKYDQALEKLAEQLKREPNNRAALMWEIRIKVLTRKYAAAAVLMNRLVQTIPVAPVDANQEVENLATARFLGRVVGFLEGPADLSPKLVDEMNDQLSVRLTDNRKQAFEESRTRVQNQFAKFKDQREKAQAEAKVKEDKEKVSKQSQLETEKGQTTRELSELSSERERIRSDQRKEEADLSREIGRADSQRLQAETRLAGIVQQWNLLQINRAQMVAALNAETDPTRQALISNDINNLDFSLGPIDAERRMREGDVLRARAFRFQLEQNRLQIRQRLQDSLAAVDKREAGIHKTENRIRAQQKKIDKPATGNSKGRLTARATAFTTYEDLASPLESEKARILNAIR